MLVVLGNMWPLGASVGPTWLCGAGSNSDSFLVEKLTMHKWCTLKRYNVKAERAHFLISCVQVRSEPTQPTLSDSISELSFCMVCLDHLNETRLLNATRLDHRTPRNLSSI